MDNTKELIIDEAFKLFLNHSYEAVSISDICNAIGLTKGALYHHFRNKEELFKMVIDKYLIIPEINVDVDVVTLYEYTQSSLTQIEKSTRKILELASAYSPISHLALLADAFRHYPGYAEAKSLLFNTEIEKIQMILENSIVRGEIRSDISTKLIATNFFSISFGLAGNLLRDHSIDEAIELLKTQISEFYNLLKK